jgi:uncharacterized membrane protein YgcG
MRRRIFALLFTSLAALALSSPAQARLFTQPELDALVAPIALYPDGLISDVLMAATRPDEVAAAARLPKDAPAEESWDPSVKSLLSFPDILARMAESPQWTRDLGEAFLGQEPHVMDTVQSLRRRAQSQGTLKSNDQVSVQQEGPAIVVQPRSEVVYVPYYDPYVVYGPWWWPAYRPVYWRPWVVAPVVVAGGFFFARPDWHARRVVVVNRATYVNGYRGAGVQRNIVARPDRRIEVRDYQRVPESQRRPIVNSAPQPRSDARQGQSRAQQPAQQREPMHLRGDAQRAQRSGTMPAAPRFSESRAQQPRGEIRSNVSRGGGDSGRAQHGGGGQGGGGQRGGGRG